ncbi:signal peptidase I [Pseudomonadota bacterium]
MNLLVYPLGMLYVARLKWALFYLIALFLFIFVDVFLLLDIDISLIWLVIFLISTIHAYLIASGSAACCKRPRYSRWYGLTLIYLAFLLMALGLRTFVYDIFRVPFTSMVPTIPYGSVLAVSKWGYGNYRLFDFEVMTADFSKQLSRGDVIVFAYPKDPSLSYVKRVVGLPGDHIAYFYKKLYINKRAVKNVLVEHIDEYDLYEEYIDGKKHFIVNMSQQSSATDGEFEVPEDQYFVLGDNRGDSSDSRDWGFVPQENIVGKVVKIFH